MSIPDPLEKWQTRIMERLVSMQFGVEASDDLKELLKELREKREVLKKLEERGLIIG